MKYSDSNSYSHTRDAAELYALSHTGCRRRPLWQKDHDGLAGLEEEPVFHIGVDMGNCMCRSEQAGLSQPNHTVVRVAREKRRYCSQEEVHMGPPSFVAKRTGSSQCEKVEVAAGSLGSYSER